MRVGSSVGNKFDPKVPKLEWPSTLQYGREQDSVASAWCVVACFFSNITIDNLICTLCTLYFI